MGGKGTENKKHNWQAQNRQGEGKSNIGSGEAKKLKCTTHGHELRRGNAEGREGGSGRRGIQKRKKWYNCISRINTIYFKKKKVNIIADHLELMV